MFNFYFNQPTIDWTTIICSAVAALIGALIGWGSTHCATNKAYKHNQELQEKELKTFEKATALSIVEELKILKELYEEEFDREYSTLGDHYYLNYTYTITQDYTTVFTQNAGEIGLIENEELRKLILNSYITLKKYMEYLIIYDKDLDKHDNRMKAFLSEIYPNLVKDCSSIINPSIEIENIRTLVDSGSWDWLSSCNVTQAQVINFLNSDLASIDDLKKQSHNLKSMYYRLKDLINQTITLAQKEYENK